MNDEEIMQEVQLLADMMNYGEIQADEAVDKLISLIKDREV